MNKFSEKAFNYILLVLIFLSIFQLIQAFLFFKNTRKGIEGMKKLQEMFPQNSPILLAEDLKSISNDLDLKTKKIVFIPDFMHDYYILGYYFAPINVFPYQKGMNLKDTYIILFKKSDKNNLLEELSLKIISESKYFIVYEVN